MKYRLTLSILMFLSCNLYSQTDNERVINEAYNGIRNNPKYSKLFELEGKQVPSWIFTKLDSNNSIIDLNNFRGKNILVFFTATYCGYCNQALPFLKEL